MTWPPTSLEVATVNLVCGLLVVATGFILLWQHRMLRRVYHEFAIGTETFDGDIIIAAVIEQVAQGMKPVEVAWHNDSPIPAHVVKIAHSVTWPAVRYHAEALTDVDEIVEPGTWLRYVAEEGCYADD